ncbi:hypothetical protein [Actinomadura sp. HBU206391]|uniref:hypothetical protein n=1 Tax=Actinomadura sp. HBU206391 TaxID=2731692 RepID=UPI001650939D|nr:hypothetical protein [Actinomadura sp. HBU206391]MBC6457923.1 hypothetical protein [Actinomadura sp. HBU206391]
MFRLDAGPGVPLYRRLARQMRQRATLGTPRPGERSPIIRHTAVGLLSGLALAGLTGCGPKSPSPTATLNAQDQMVKFAQCLRQQGLDVPDPQPGATGITIDEGDDRSRFDAAMRACRQYSPKKDIDPNDPAVHDRGVKMAECLRRQGLNVPDPQPGRPLEISGNGETDDEVRIQRAQGVCRKELNAAAPTPAGSGG